MPQTLGRFQMRSAPPREGADWFRIENKKTEDSKPKAEVYIYDEIGYWGTTAADFVRELTALDVDEIDLHINSPGGDVFDGVAIHSALRAHKAKVTVIVDALAASAASFIAQAGDEVVMTRNATMMIHDASGMAYGNAATMRKLADTLDAVSNNIADIYSQKNDTSAEDWRALMQEEVWYSAQEAVDAGLATSVLDTSDKQAEKAVDNWNLSVFNYAGRNQAPPPARVLQQVKFSNTSKEARVGTLKNTDEPAGATGDGETIPEGEVGTTNPTGTDGEQSEPVTGEEAQQNEGNGVPAAGETPQPTPGQAAAPQNVSTSGQAITVIINGVRESDPSKIQAYVAGLEGFRNDSLIAGKKAFVASLATSNKIAASQITQLEEFALELSDTAYDKWKATWDVAPAATFLGQHGNGVTNATGNNSATADEIEVQETILASLKRSGMTQEQLEKTSTWAKLQTLKSTN